jgi:hypothetical protein
MDRGCTAARGESSVSGNSPLHAVDVLTFAPAVGKPYEGEPHVRFDEGVLDTRLRISLNGHEGGNPGHRQGRGLRATAPALYSTDQERHGPSAQGFEGADGGSDEGRLQAAV